MTDTDRFVWQVVAAILWFSAGYYLGRKRRHES